MPLYEYKCSNCGKTLEILQKRTDPPLSKCEACHSENTMEKMISNTSFQLKGGGWYKDLYASKKPADKKVAPATSRPAAKSASGK